MFIPQTREASHMLPKCHCTPDPALPAPRGSQSAEGPQGLLCWTPQCCSSWGSLVEVTLLLCQILLAGQSVPGPVLLGSMVVGGDRRAGTHSWVIQLCSSLHTLALVRHCQPVTPGFVTPSISVTISLLSHLQRGHRAPPHPYLLAITF